MMIHITLLEEQVKVPLILCLSLLGAVVVLLVFIFGGQNRHLKFATSNSPVGNQLLFVPCENLLQIGSCQYANIGLASNALENVVLLFNIGCSSLIMHLSCELYMTTSDILYFLICVSMDPP